MDAIDLLGFRLTSVSVRKSSFELLKNAQNGLAVQGVSLTGQQIFRELIRLYLKKWRGVGCRTSRLRRYNLKGKGYVVKALYLDLGLWAAAWGRALHSGVTISRMLDFAIRHYLHILVRMHLQQEKTSVKRQTPINYQCITWKNSGRNLKFAQLIDYGLPPAMPP